jgi:hypothetical protein
MGREYGQTVCRAKPGPGASPANAHIGPRRNHSAELAQGSANEAGPPYGAPGRTCGRPGYAVGRSPNLPRWAFTKRACSPLEFSSRNTAEYNVASGVLPPGLLQ